MNYNSSLPIFVPDSVWLGKVLEDKAVKYVVKVDELEGERCLTVLADVVVPVVEVHAHVMEANMLEPNSLHKGGGVHVNGLKNRGMNEGRKNE